MSKIWYQYIIFVSEKVWVDALCVMTIVYCTQNYVKNYTLVHSDGFLFLLRILGFSWKPI